MMLAYMVVGQVLTWPIVKLCTTDKTQEQIMFLAQHDLGWLYLAVWVIKNAGGAINGWQLYWRTRVGVLGPNQHIYKVMRPKGSKQEEESYVLMANTGSMGR